MTNKTNEMPSADHVKKVLADELKPKVKYVTNADPVLTLEDAQKFIGGYVERVKLVDGRRMLVDEDAQLKKSKINNVATDIFNKSGTSPFMYNIFGNVIVIESNVRKGGW